jgi:hypothetical protein
MADLSEPREDLDEEESELPKDRASEPPEDITRV